MGKLAVDGREVEENEKFERGATAFVTDVVTTAEVEIGVGA